MIDKTAETILKMIEEVDPQDSAALDNIDYLVECFTREDDSPVWSGTSYTRSRDAIKSIRPDGVSIANSSNHFWRHWDKANGKEPRPVGWQFTIDFDGRINSGTTIWSQILPTEELAELHAVIQAIAFERRNNGKE